MRTTRAPSRTEPLADVESLRQAALRLLERTRRTRSDLERRLRERGGSATHVAEVLERLAGVGLVDDVEFARAFLAGRWGRRATGWRRIEQELRRRGISGDDIVTARARLEAERGATDEAALARRAIEQSARKYAALEPWERKRRLWALLTRRGFSPDAIEQALREASEGSERD